MSYVAISKVRFPPSFKEQIQNVGLEMIPIAKRQPGFVSVAFHLSTDSSETMMYWEWESKSDHEACMESAAWANIMGKSSSLFQSQGVEFSIQTYERIS